MFVESMDERDLLRSGSNLPSLSLESSDSLLTPLVTHDLTW